MLLAGYVGVMDPAIKKAIDETLHVGAYFAIDVEAPPQDGDDAPPTTPGGVVKTVYGLAVTRMPGKYVVRFHDGRNNVKFPPDTDGDTIAGGIVEIKPSGIKAVRAATMADFNQHTTAKRKTQTTFLEDDRDDRRKERKRPRSPSEAPAGTKSGVPSQAATDTSVAAKDKPNPHRDAEVVAEASEPPVLGKESKMDAVFRRHQQHIATVNRYLTCRMIPTLASASDDDEEEGSGGQNYIGFDETMAYQYTTGPSAKAFHRRFKKLVKIGEGTFGEVYCAQDQATGVLVVVKKMKVPCSLDYGVHNTIIREIQVSTLIRHPNVLPLLAVAMLEDQSCNLVFPLVAHDLPALLREWRRKQGHSRNNPLHIATVKCIFSQLLKGLSAMHECNILHRDIKSSNVLVDHDGTAILCDFGWSRLQASDQGRHTWPPCTLFYRPFELLVGERKYGVEVDIWGMGCLLFEMLALKPLIPAEDEMSAISQIVDMIGSPPEELYPHDKFKMIPRSRHDDGDKMRGPYDPSKADTAPEAPRPKVALAAKGVPLAPVTSASMNRLKRFLDNRSISNDVAEFLARMVCYDRKERATARQLLNDPWLTGHGRGATASILPLKPHEMSLPKTNNYRFYAKAVEADKERDLWVGSQSSM